MNYNQLITNLEQRKANNEPFFDILKQIETCNEEENLLHKNTVLCVDYDYLNDTKKSKKYCLMAIIEFKKIINSKILTNQEFSYIINLLENNLIILYKINLVKATQILFKYAKYIQKFGKILLNYLINISLEKNKNEFIFYALFIVPNQIEFFEKIFETIQINGNRNYRSELLINIKKLFIDLQYELNLPLEVINLKVPNYPIKLDCNIINLIICHLSLLNVLEGSYLFDLILSNFGYIYELYYISLQIENFTKLKYLIGELLNNKNIIDEKNILILNLIIESNYLEFNKFLNKNQIIKYLFYLYKINKYELIIEYYEKYNCSNTEKIEILGSIYILIFKCYIKTKQFIKANEILLLINNNCKINQNIINNKYNSSNLLEEILILQINLNNHTAILNIFNELNELEYINGILILYNYNYSIIPFIHLYLQKYKINAVVLKMIISIIFISQIELRERIILIYRIIKPIKYNLLDRKTRIFIYKVIYNCILENISNKTSILLNMTKLMLKYRFNLESVYLGLIVYQSEYFYLPNKTIERLYIKFTKKYSPNKLTTGNDKLFKEGSSNRECTINNIKDTINNNRELYYNIIILFYQIKYTEIFPELLPLKKLTNQNIILLSQSDNLYYDINNKISIFLECKLRNISYEYLLDTIYKSGIINALSFYEKLSCYCDIKDMKEELNRFGSMINDEWVKERFNKLIR